MRLFSNYFVSVVRSGKYKENVTDRDFLVTNGRVYEGPTCKNNIRMGNTWRITVSSR